MIPLVTAEQMRSEEAAVFAAGTTEDELSDRAAVAIHRRLLEMTPAGGMVLVLAGPGNNGLDGVKVHRLLQGSGAPAELICWNRADCPPFDSGALSAALGRARVVLDGLFGIGLAREVEGEPAAILRAINSVRDARSRSRDPLSVVALDIPSGINADTGAVMGVAAEADTTITLGFPKVGLFTGAGPAHAGRVEREPIGLSVREETQAAAQGFDSSQPTGLPSRRVGSHKNDNGRVLVIGGSLRYAGAPVLAALSAQRAGAGYVTVGFPRSMLGVIASRLLEQTLLPLPEDDVGTLGPSSVEETREGAKGYKALVLGNGLHREDPTVAFALSLLGIPAADLQRRVGFAASAGGGNRAFPPARRPVGFRAPAAEEERERQEPAQLPPTVVDGDGLYALSTHPGWWESTPSVALLTPHPGEMARLVGCEVGEVEADRLGVAGAAAERWGKTVLLKGSYPVVASPGAQAQVLVESHPELGTAGTGDVLAGLCGLALSVGLPPADAARAALVLGARAASLAADHVGVDALSAGDLIEALPGARRGDAG
jgi:NAD(P)H-hydrate epimerase